MYKPEFDSRKFRDLALYLAHRSKDDPNFGMVKLQLMMYYCDFIAYHRTGKSITGATYVKRPFGPAPKEFADEVAKMTGAKA